MTHLNENDHDVQMELMKTFLAFIKKKLHLKWLRMPLIKGFLLSIIQSYIGKYGRKNISAHKLKT